MNADRSDFVPIHIDARFSLDSLALNVEFGKTVDDGLLELFIMSNKERTTKRR